jgi:hypothetical protein
MTSHEFDDLEKAKQYADDCASETEDGPVYAYVFDSDFQQVHYGQHY